MSVIHGRRRLLTLPHAQETYFRSQRRGLNFVDITEDPPPRHWVRTPLGVSQSHDWASMPRNPSLSALWARQPLMRRACTPLRFGFV